MDTSVRYSPWDQLPADEPKSVRPPADQFYQRTVKHLIKDVVRIMDNGLHVDMDKVIELEAVLEQQLDNVATTLAGNAAIQKYQLARGEANRKLYIEDRKQKLRSPEHYLKPFKYSDMLHRSYFMDVFCKARAIQQPEALLPTGVPKWPVNLVKKLAKDYPILAKLITNGLTETNPTVVEAMANLRVDKAAMYNEKFLAQIANPAVDLPPFNPQSSKQKIELFAMLGIESEEVSKKTGLAKWDRAQVERVNKMASDELVTSLTSVMIDHSYASIVNNNFIQAFYKYTVESRLYGSLKLFGAKSFRLTSQNPNLLNMPSSRSVFAKPIKRCFTAPKGKLIATVDYAALEDRVIGNLSGDKNKLAVFTEGIDGHSLSCCYYWPELVSHIIGSFTDYKKAARVFFAEVEKGNKEAERIRQASKAVTFGLK